MAVPTKYALQIKVDDVDITAYVPYESLSFEDYARQVSTFRMTIQNPSGVTPARASTVKVYAINLTGTPIIFNGYITEIISKKRDNGITKEYECDCADMKWRLQNAVLPYNEFSGSDLDILSSLLGNAYPDLSDLFDFSTDATALLADMDFTVNDETLLDALNRLADETGADWRLDNLVEKLTDTVTFDPVGYTNYVISHAHLDSATETTGGNPGDCAKGLDTSDATGPPALHVEITFDTLIDILDIDLDYYYSHVGGSAGTPRWAVDIKNGGSGGTTVLTASIDAVTGDANWHDSIASTGSYGAWTAPPYTGDWVRIRLFSHTAYTSTDLRLDNIAIIHGGTGETPLQWAITPDTASFDIDVSSVDEFAFDIDLTEGDFDDFNSVLVTGGYEEIAVDWIYDADGEQDHFDLELPVKNLVVYKNTGSDTSVTWTAQALGQWGGAAFISDGGSADVLYDNANHWLYFDTNPANLVKSIRITGSIARPIQVRVEGIQGTTPVLATAITDTSITSVDAAVSLGNAALEKQNSIKRLSFTTYAPGLKAGQSMTVTDSARGLSEVLTIQRISTKWIGSSGHAQFEVECGAAESTGADTLIANADKRSRERPPALTVNTQVVNLLTDDSNVVMTDDSGVELYESETQSLYTDDSNVIMTDNSLIQLYEAA